MRTPRGAPLTDASERIGKMAESLESRAWYATVFALGVEVLPEHAAPDVRLLTKHVLPGAAPNMFSRLMASWTPASATPSESALLRLYAAKPSSFRLIIWK